MLPSTDGTSSATVGSLTEAGADSAVKPTGHGALTGAADAKARALEQRARVTGLRNAELPRCAVMVDLETQVAVAAGSRREALHDRIGDLGDHRVAIEHEDVVDVEQDDDRESRAGCDVRAGDVAEGKDEHAAVDQRVAHV